jgi:hypothetical protein
MVLYGERLTRTPLCPSQIYLRVIGGPSFQFADLCYTLPASFGDKSRIWIVYNVGGIGHCSR